MEIARLIEALSDPAAYPHAVEKVDIHQTHLSVVFLAGPFAYKIKKPVSLGFVDFSTLERRYFFAMEELRLNRRLAHGIYLDVLSIAQTERGLRVGADGDAIEWAVKMTRLPAETSFASLLSNGKLDENLLLKVAGRLASFHESAERGENVSSQARFDVVAQNARENFSQAEPMVEGSVSRAVLVRLASLTEEELRRLYWLINSRANRGKPRDTHGDLRLDHVYIVPGEEPPNDLAIIDCIEFNERFRYADPIADIAFLTMDLRYAGREDLAKRFVDAYIRISGDTEGLRLLPFYVSYRAAVRGKVEGIASKEPEVPRADREGSLARARAYWLLALSTLESPTRRPALVLVGGLPGSGKSTLAKILADRASFEVIRSDIVRKSLAGLSEHESARAGTDEGIYTPEWTEKTYAACLTRAEALLFAGKRVVVDASFRESARRSLFLDTARRWSVCGLYLECRAAREIVRDRLVNRRDDASDADWPVYEQAAARWEKTAATHLESERIIEADRGIEVAFQQADSALRSVGLST
jgi:uncharacterized protein